MVEKEKYLYNSPIKGEQKKKLSFRLKPINWKHLSTDLQNIIASREEGGVALATEFGDSEMIGITQKKLTEANSNLQSQINTIFSEKATVTLSASSDTFIIGNAEFTLTASTDTDAENIVIKQGDEVLATGSGRDLEYVVTLSQDTAASISYTAEFTFAGDNKRTIDHTINFVKKMYVGSADNPMAIYADEYVQPARVSPQGTYNITVSEDGDKVFFILPYGITIHSATMNGFDFPLEYDLYFTDDYTIYGSVNGYDAGTLTIVIS